MMAKGTIFIISAPSGAGKTSLIKKLLEEIDNIVFSISYTTRAPRGSEVDGKDYFFISESKFKQMIDKEEFLEYAKVHNHYYGTGKDYVLKNINSGKDIVLDIDWQGAKIVKDNLNQKEINLISIFILPPSFEALKERLLNRGTDSEEVINLRLKNALKEIEQSLTYDYLIINDNFSVAFDNLYAIFKSNRLKSCYMQEKVEKIIKSYNI